MGREYLLYVLLLFILVLSGFQDGKRISYFQCPTISLEPVDIKAHFVDFNDSISSDTLYQLLSEEGHPVSYYRKFQTGICFDNKCRMLDIVLYWNITGRYLGFELPEEEFLSKTEHEPFEPSEYERLHEILADTRSPLANFTYNQLVLKPPPLDGSIDGVSSATAPEVLEHVVEGAVYTTYVLWHLIHGPAQQAVERLTIESLSTELVLEIFKSPDKSDIMWVLNYINGYVELTPELSKKIVNFIDDENYSLAERAINAINPEELKSDPLQLLLLDRFHNTGYSLKKLIIDKFREAPALNDKVKLDLANNLKQLNGEILSRTVEIFKHHQVSEIFVYQKVAELLEVDNYFISKKAYDFLLDSKFDNNKIESLLRKYESKHNLPKRR